MRRIAIAAGDASSSMFAANAAYEKVVREYPDATELHLADGLGQSWNRMLTGERLDQRPLEH